LSRLTNDACCRLCQPDPPAILRWTEATILTDRTGAIGDDKFVSSIMFYVKGVEGKVPTN